MSFYFGAMFDMGFCFEERLIYGFIAFSNLNSVFECKLGHEFCKLIKP